MLPSNFRQANLVLKGPEGSGIIDLPVFANADENTQTSLWIPNDEERRTIAEGGGVVVSVFGGVHPPIGVGAAAIEYGQHYGAQDEVPASS
ncbi:hypothetical protein [Sinorhizobium meliloti]|uniref:hypothetical protein n=1 Tax=Rhizobium meliloti TaxID=382 RepID=UPI001297D867|nr:hypothetical protein [Sinorhizobium meliloti]MDW9491690.1 hypothetical protein [Sinorhizobium meliloti]MQV02956.1 hypothetical protein [Sinorhizobium meliloti]